MISPRYIEAITTLSSSFLTVLYHRRSKIIFSTSPAVALDYLMSLKQTSRKPIRLTAFVLYWCPGGDSNSHAIRRYHLKIVCLPIPPPGHSCFCIKKPRPWQVFFPAFFKFSRNRPKRQTHATEKAPDPGLRHHAGAALRLTDAPSTDIVIVTSAFREPDGGRAANPARSERKQR